MTKLELIMHPIRFRIMQVLSSRQLSEADIAHHLTDIPASLVARHVAMLLEAGTLTQLPDGRYGIAAGGDTFDADDISEITPEQYTAYFGVFANGLIQNFAGYVKATGGGTDSEMYFDEYFYMSDDEYGEFINDVLALFAKTQNTQPERGKKRRKFAVIMHDDYDDQV